MNLEKDEILKEKNKKINNEIKRLGSILKDVDSKKKRTAKGLTEEAAFMKVTLMELKETIKVVGAIDEMPQGDYSILREHPALKSYNTMVQRYSTILKQLVELLPKDIQINESDGFDEFAGTRGE